MRRRTPDRAGHARATDPPGAAAGPPGLGWVEIDWGAISTPSHGVRHPRGRPHETDVAHTDFWDAVRELRGILVAAGELDWSHRLRTALAPTARRRGTTEEVAVCLRDLREQEVARRLGLEPLLARLLATIEPEVE